MNIGDVPNQPFSRLGQSCISDKQCEVNDPHSHCKPLHDHDYHLVLKCTCKPSFNLEIVNGTERCVYFSDLEEPDFEDLTAAPIILCFVGCIVIEIVCLLGFRYWRKHRMQSIFQRRELGLATAQRFGGIHSTALPLVTFSVMHPPNPIISGVCITAAPTPPAYGCGNSTQAPQATTGSTLVVQSESVLPSYEEAVKMPEPIRNVDDQSCNEMGERKAQSSA